VASTPTEIVPAGSWLELRGQIDLCGTPATAVLPFGFERMGPTAPLMATWEEIAVPACSFIMGTGFGSVDVPDRGTFEFLHWGPRVGITAKGPLCKLDTMVPEKAAKLLTTSLL
jgi:hypothetical protein